MRKKPITCLVGIDEVGRGPIAGPVAVGVFACLNGKVPAVFKKVRESKQLTSEGREQWLEIIKKEEKKGTIAYAVSFVSASIIDTKGITYAIKKALENSLLELELDATRSRVLLDGGLKAPVEYIFQKTIIRGDVHEPVIALASIVAKTARDKKMVLFAKKYRQYDFAQHKGYGTARHYLCIKKYGLCPLHRRSFLKKVARP